MTLAVIFLVSIFWTASAPPAVAAPVRQSAQQPADKPATPDATKDQSGLAQDSSTAKPTPPSVPAKPTPKRHHKKKIVPANCVSTPAAGTAPPGAAPTDAASGASAPADCPPPKVIVRQGGTADPTIRLAGGAVGDQAAQQRKTTHQMMGATEQNLKKIAGLQLTSNQQDMVNQVRQFMEQSKSAVAAGDLERARTLAWKAQLLSEELLKPQK